MYVEEIHFRNCY